MATDVPRIDPSDIADALRRGERVVYVDARSPTAWDAATEQIPGSLRVTADAVASRADELPPAAVTVVYCTWPHENSSARAALTLRELGHSRAFALRGGFDAWKRAGLPVEPKQVPGGAAAPGP